MNNFDMLWKDTTDRVLKKANIAHPLVGPSTKNTCMNIRNSCEHFRRLAGAHLANSLLLVD
jgi:hypothetical protein